MKGEAILHRANFCSKTHISVETQKKKRKQKEIKLYIPKGDEKCAQTNHFPDQARGDTWVFGEYLSQGEFVNNLFKIAIHSIACCIY